MEAKRTFPKVGVWIVGVVLLIVAVAAAAFFAGTVVAKRTIAPMPPSNGASPPSELVWRITHVPGVTSAVEASPGESRRLFVVVDAAGWGEDEREAFLERLREAIDGELSGDRVVFINREGGKVLSWDLGSAGDAGADEREGIATKAPRHEGGMELPMNADGRR
ncbi:MAG: hypothetical protein V2A58_01690 [Planctomycetota bacterium]